MSTGTPSTSSSRTTEDLTEWKEDITIIDREMNKEGVSQKTIIIIVTCTFSSIVVLFSVLSAVYHCRRRSRQGRHEVHRKLGDSVRVQIEREEENQVSIIDIMIQ